LELNRRKFFTHFGQVMAAKLLPGDSGRPAPPSNKGAEPAAPKPGLRPWLRPPGALHEATFLKKCTRCTACVEACPYDSIRRLGPEFGTVAGTPVIIPTESPCYLCADTPCIPACEDGALIPLPVAEVSMGSALINDNACYLSQGQPCDYCVKRCPIGENAIAMDSKGLPAVAEGCVGCGVCTYLCPADAIVIAPRLDL